jgi:lipopolysaccharide/colanic/teichoic acid biosynthesis glycosyltransferase
VVDIVLAASGLLLLSPLILLVAIAIKLDSAGPIFGRETLYGYANQTVRVFKFRSTVACAESDRMSSCVTRIGKLIRHTGTDRLPQLLNVLLGELSIVGPRAYANRQDLPKVHVTPLLEDFKPGMTGWAQLIESRDGSTTAEQRIADDLHYVECWSLALDIKIVLMTLFS